MASTDALPIPRKNIAYRVVFPIMKSDGTIITSWAGAAATISKDQASSGSATNTPTEIATTWGIGYLDLTSAEMNCDCLAVKITVTNTGAVTTTLVLYPMEDVDIRSNVVDWSGSAVNGLISGKVDSVNSMVSGTASAGAANSITLTGASATDNLYKYSLVQIVGGTGAGQVRVILDYVGSTKVATIGKAWTTTPDNTSVYVVIPFAEPEIVHAGIAQTGAAATITLQSVASATDNVFNGDVIVLIGGTGSLQSRVITAYNGTTKIATVDQAWVTTPDSTSIYKVMSFGRSWSDVFMWNGTAVSSPATAGIPDVNTKNINNVSASSVTTVNANQGTTQPVNFTGTGASALAKGDTIDWASGAIPAPAVTGVPKIDLSYILGTLLTETAGQIAAAFKKLFDVSFPTLTAQDVNQTGDSYARIGANGAGLTALGDTRIAHLNADVDSRLAPTVAGRTLDVSAGGEAGLDWANLGSPTATNDLTNTKINTTDNAVPATLAASQPNYAPAKAGDQMDLVNAPNATAVTAIQLGLSKPGTAQTIDQTTALPGLPSVGTIGEALKRADAQTGDSFARLGAPAGASVSADIAEIEAETDDIAAIKAKTDLLSTTGVTVPTDDVATGELTFYVGSTYSIADGTAKTLNDDLAMDLSSATASFEFGGHSFSVTIGGTSGAWIYQIEMSEAQGDAIGGGAEFTAALYVTLVNEHKMPPRWIGKAAFVSDL